MVGQNSAKHYISSVAKSLPLQPLMKKLFRTDINIVYYHFVGETQPYYKAFSGNCSIDRFDNDLRLLKNYFDIVPLQRVLDLARNGDTASHPLLAVTFDDGFNLIRSGVMEVLGHHRVSAAVFVITSCVGNENLMWRNKLSAIQYSVDAERFVRAFNAMAADWGQTPVGDVKAIMTASLRWPMLSKEERVEYLWDACGMPPLAAYLDRYKPYMTWDDLDVWTSRGHSVGLHTHTHPVCTDLNNGQVDEEIVKPSATLKEKTGLDAVPFSYPFGCRLPREKEKALFENRTIQCALGIRGSTPIGTPLYQLERADAEHGLSFPVFGKRLTRFAMPFLPY